jgi:hypothetical protein
VEDRDAQTCVGHYLNHGVQAGPPILSAALPLLSSTATAQTVQPIDPYFPVAKGLADRYEKQRIFYLLGRNTWQTR